VTAREEIRRAYEALLPPGLVLGHRVIVYHVGVGRAYRGNVERLDPVTIRLDRVKWVDEFRVGDRVRALHQGRHAVEAEVVAPESGALHLKLLVNCKEE
jgi:hypothetical protein